MRTFTENAPILEHDWLDYRFKLFEKFCFPAVAGQVDNDFYWAILFHPKTPDVFMERVAELQRRSPRLKLFIGEDFSGILVKELSKLKPTEFLVTTRLDNDDSICQDFIGQVKQKAREYITQEKELNLEATPLLLDFSSGYFTVGDYLYETTVPANHFCSMVSPLTDKRPIAEEDLKTVFSLRHPQIRKQPGYREIEGNPLWLEVIHETNVKNYLRNKLTPCDRFKTPFSIDWTPRPVEDSDRKSGKILRVPFSVASRSALGRTEFLRQINAGKRYLQLGNFDLKNCLKAKGFDQRIGVSPHYQSKKKKQSSASKTIHYAMVSDDFFREHSSLDLSFDLIGVGEFYQFNRILHGFRQGLEYSHGRTIFILNNTFPISRAAALPDHDDYMAARQETGDVRRAWMGDNYKLVFALRDFFPQLSFATMPRHSQTIAWFKSREPVEPAFQSIEAIAALTYDDFLNLQEYLNIQEDFKAILKTIDRDLNGTNEIFDSLNTD
ncbi:MAG: glycosyltransferase [Cyanophyceae cyanobacterium]